MRRIILLVCFFAMVPTLYADDNARFIGKAMIVCSGKNAHFMLFSDYLNVNPYDWVPVSDGAIVRVVGIDESAVSIDSETGKIYPPSAVAVCKIISLADADRNCDTQRDKCPKVGDVLACCDYALTLWEENLAEERAKNNLIKKAENQAEFELSRRQQLLDKYEMLMKARDGRASDEEN